MPKVLRILNRFNLGGPTYNAAYLSKYMEPEFETKLVGGAIDETEDSSQHILSDLDLKPTIIPEMKREVDPVSDRLAYKRIKKIIAAYKPDIVHTHASKAGAIGRYAAHDMKVPVIVHTFHGHVFHSYFNNIKTNLYKNIERYLAKRTTRIVAISAKQKDELVQEHRICNDDKISIIPLGFDLDRFQQELDKKREEFRNTYHLEDNEIAIGIIGRLVPIKNHEMFLKAIKEVSTRTEKKIRAFIVGDGEERSNLEQKAEELGLAYTNADNANQKALLTFTSWIKNVDVVNAGMDIITLTSKNEGTPVSLIEAQAANKPIVSTNVGGVENIVVPNKTALLCSTDDHVQLIDHLLNIVNNDDLRMQLGKDGWAHVKDKFHYTRLVDDMSSLYYSLLN